MRFLTNRNSLLRLAGALVLLGGLAIAQGPKDNVSGGWHPSLPATQRLRPGSGLSRLRRPTSLTCRPRPKAKGLLDEVNKELKLAAESANHKGK